MVGVANVIDEGSHPHTPARLYLRSVPRSINIRSLCKPTALGAVLPAVCLPEPSDYSMIEDVQQRERGGTP